MKDRQDQLPQSHHAPAASLASLEDVAGKKQENRRRILRGALGAPVIYTLSSGSVLAQGSSCMMKDGNYYEAQVVSTYPTEPDAGSEATPSGDEVTSSDDVATRTVVIDGQEVCNLDVDGRCDIDGTRYRFYGKEENGVLATESCWNSIHPTGLKSLLP